jgi:pimeloyl-ACP methyl ester carboxylesterase
MSERPGLPSGHSWHDVEVADHRRVEVLTGGPEDGFPFVYHSGTPSGAAAFPTLVDAAAERGFRTITYSRPGYGSSTTALGRTVSDAADDTAAVLDALGHDASSGHAGRFVTMGWSGGGPHALACSALLADRCVATEVIAGVAPYDGKDLDWTAGMGEENVSEFELAHKGGEEFEALLKFLGEAMQIVTEPATVVEALGSLVGERDKEAVMTHPIGDYLIASFQQAVLDGTAGWRDDDLAFVTAWGFDVTEITSPVTVWQGTEDRMVPTGHGQWLAAHVPSARLEVSEGEGHISIVPIVIPLLLDDLATAAGLRG